MIKTFRGLMTDPEQIRIKLGTIKGKVGYRINKLQVMPNDIDGSNTHEDSLQIWKTNQTAPVPDIDFGDSDLLAAAYYMRTTSGGGSPTAVASEIIIIFDNEIFNQDIYIVMESGQGGVKLNYYLELEVVPLDDAGAEYTTLKDMRTGSSLRV